MKNNVTNHAAKNLTEMELKLFRGFFGVCLFVYNKHLNNSLKFSITAKENLFNVAGSVCSLLQVYY